MNETILRLKSFNDFQVGNREKAQMEQCMGWWNRQNEDRDAVQTLSRNEDKAYADQLKHLEVWQANFAYGSCLNFQQHEDAFCCLSSPVHLFADNVP